MPVAKTNDSSSLSDYRPICILPSLSKAMEIIIRNQIATRIERSRMMSWLQSGCIANQNTTTVLVKITNDLLLASEEKLISIFVLMDFSNVFDSVDHQLLCSKLSIQSKSSNSAGCWPYKVLSMRPNAMALDKKSGIKSPASHIRISIRPTAFFIIQQRYHERYCIVSMSPVRRRHTTLHQLPFFRVCWLYQ
jgi:hypothetical protein